MNRKVLLFLTGMLGLGGVLTLLSTDITPNPSSPGNLGSSTNAFPATYSSNFYWWDGAAWTLLTNSVGGGGTNWTDAGGASLTGIGALTMSGVLTIDTTNEIGSMGSVVNGVGFTNGGIFSSGSQVTNANLSGYLPLTNGTSISGTPVDVWNLNETGDFIGAFILHSADTDVPVSLYLAQGDGTNVTSFSVVDGHVKAFTLTLSSNLTMGGTITAPTLSMDAANAGTLVVTNPPVLDLSASTNLNGSSLFYKTNVSTPAPNFFLPYSIFTTNAAFAFLAPLNVSLTNAQTAVVLVTNSTGSAVAVTAPANVHTQGTWNVTNVSTFTFFNYGGTFTNAIALPLW